MKLGYGKLKQTDIWCHPVTLQRCVFAVKPMKLGYGNLKQTDIWLIQSPFSIVFLSVKLGYANLKQRHGVIQSLFSIVLLP